MPRRVGSHRLSGSGRQTGSMPERVMFVQLQTGYDIDQGPAWISVVRFNRTWKTATWHGKTLRRWQRLFDANYYDVETREEY